MFFYFKYILQHFKFVNWRIGKFVFLMSQQVIIQISCYIIDVCSLRLDFESFTLLAGSGSTDLNRLVHVLLSKLPKYIIKITTG